MRTATLLDLLRVSLSFGHRTMVFIAMLVLPIITLNAQTFAWPAGVHDPSSIVKDGNKYWIFATGDGIVSKYSTDMVTWAAGPTPFTTTDFPAWIHNYAKTSTETFKGFFWAPDIIYMNGKYHLYYSCSIWGTMSSCIGVVTNKTLDPASPDYKWEDQGDMGIYSNGGTVNGVLVNAIDPAVMKGPDKRVWLTYGSFNRDGIVVAELDSLTGKPKNTIRTSIANSWTGGTAYGEGEGGCMAYNNGYYYIFYNKGGCCAGIASSYYVVVGRSPSPTGPYVDKQGVLMRKVNATSGGTRFFGHDNARGEDDRYYGPGHLGIYRENGTDFVSFHYYDPNGYYPNEAANYKGGPTLGLGMLKWGADGWPTMSFNFLEKGYYTINNVNSAKALDLTNRSTATATILKQVTPNTLWDTQKWLFTPLGTGEYTIRSYADTTKYIEAVGATYDDKMQVAASYTGSVNQKFRLLQTPVGKMIIYPSTKDKVLESNTTINYQLLLNTVSATYASGNGQRWSATPFIETLSASHATADFTDADTICTAISVLSNGSWAITGVDPTWLTVAPTSGSGNIALTITATTNEADAARQNTLTIRSKGGQSITLPINQAAKTSTPVKKATTTSFDVYPNPTTGLLNVRFQTPAMLTVYNSLGSPMVSKSISVSPATIELSDLPTGIYFVEIKDNFGSAIKKIVKK